MRAESWSNTQLYTIDILTQVLSSSCLHRESAWSQLTLVSCWQKSNDHKPLLLDLNQAAIKQPFLSPAQNECKRIKNEIQMFKPIFHSIIYSNTHTHTKYIPTVTSNITQNTPQLVKVDQCEHTCYHHTADKLQWSTEKLNMSLSPGVT